MAEKDAAARGTEIEETENVGATTGGTMEIKRTAVASVALTDALARDVTPKFSKSMLQLYGIMVLVTLNDVMNGYDGSLMSSINAMKPWHDQFHVAMQGGGIGIIFAIYTIGSTIGALFAAEASDRFGRRFGMFTGSIFIVIGAVLETSASRTGQFMGGRFLVGFGVSLANTAAPIYLVETAYPSWRGLFGGLYNVVGYYSGAIIANWTSYGTGKLSTNWSWRIPTIIQCVPSLIVIATVWFLPESPRWLIAHNKQDQAIAFLTKYHGNGNPDAAVVQLELNEINEDLNFEIESSGNRWWDYRPLFSSRPNLHRVFLLLLVSVFSQFIGGSVISYYMPVILQDVGITGSGQQLLLNALNTVFSLCGGLVGACFVDKIGRRPLFLWATFLTGLCYVPINVIAARADGHVGTGPGYAFIAFIFLYGIIFSFGWTPLQALYPAEIVYSEIRAKGVAFQSFLGGVASFINTYATPVALKNIGWRTYTIFLSLHFLQFFIMYLTIVETKGKTLEEIGEIFDSKHPVRESLRKREVIIKKGEGVKLEEPTAEDA